MKMKLMVTFVVLALMTICVTAQATVTLYTPFAGDATYSWNTKYGPYGYTAGGTEMGVSLYMGAPYGNDYTVSIFMIPIATLADKTVLSATLQVDALGFDTGYYYGSAKIGWVDTGSKVLTGDVVADQLGAGISLSSNFTIWDSGVPYTPGLKTFDVLSLVQTDLAAGRSYTTFVMHGSRDTWGSIYTAESGRGPLINAEVLGETVPEPATIISLVAGAAGLLLRRRRS